ncbi:helix-turn-helix domain-containing protein [Falsibacillus albus]|uniref:XRE family transcriptional regulator n=1 Tax=Falsibacillus albus TaxID=2478915 RepID=A0A3L7K2Q4_9BACI|nr:XRE family transcriptional regulator [Falsibacillus albus]RLQ97268.1 XRE family transcriptional regulator [Falsibacillus albus]
MEHLQKQIGENLKKIRKNRELSLDQTAALTGVSKAMLGQIERGESNPTVATLWKIANGLKVSFSTFLKKPGSPVTIINSAELEPIQEDGGKYRVFNIFPYDPNKKLEIYKVELSPGCSYTSEGHPNGVEEFITVNSGKLTLEVNDEVYEVKQGSSLHFHADFQHTYQAQEETVCQMVIYYHT